MPRVEISVVHVSPRQVHVVPADGECPAGAGEGEDEAVRGRGQCEGEGAVLGDGDQVRPGLPASG